MSAGKEAVSLGKGRAVAESNMAIRVRFGDNLKGSKMKPGDEVWIPQSVIHDDSEVWASGQSGKVVVELWWAESRGWA